MRTLPMLLVLVGALLALAGLVFTLQGLGVIGPDSSVMFQSQTWTDQGVAVMATGVLVEAGGLFLARKKKT